MDQDQEMDQAPSQDTDHGKLPAQDWGQDMFMDRDPIVALDLVTILMSKPSHPEFSIIIEGRPFVNEILTNDRH